MKVQVRSSTPNLAPSDVVWWFMSNAVLAVMAGGAVVKWYDGNTSTEEEWGQLTGLRCS